MSVKEIAEMILRGTDEGETPNEIAMGIATAINDEWYYSWKDAREVIIEK